MRTINEFEAAAKIIAADYSVPVDVMFYRGMPGKVCWDKLTSWWTDGPFSHVECRFNGELAYSSTMRDDDKGTRFKVIDPNPKHWDIYRLNLSPEKTKALFEYFVSQRRKPYDLKGIFGFILFKEMEDPAKWYCSEVVARGLETIDFMEFPRLISPNKMYELFQDSPEKSYRILNGGTKD